MSRRDHFMLRKGATKIDMGRARGAPRIEEEDAATSVITINCLLLNAIEPI